MGRNRRRRAAGGARSHDVNDRRSEDDIIVLLESKSIQSSDTAVKAVSPPVWTIDFFDNFTITYWICYRYRIIPAYRGRKNWVTYILTI